MRFPASLATTALLGFVAPLARGEDFVFSLVDILGFDGNFDILAAAAISVDLESSLSQLGMGGFSKSAG
jgi:hypothetical protein